MQYEKTVSKEVKKPLKDNIIVLTIRYASETRTCNKCQRSNIQAIEMIYLKDGFGVNRMDGESFLRLESY